MEDLYTNQEARLRFEAYRYNSPVVNCGDMPFLIHLERLSVRAAACKPLLWPLERVWPSQR